MLLNDYSKVKRTLLLYQKVTLLFMYQVWSNGEQCLADGESAYGEVVLDLERYVS